MCRPQTSPAPSVWRRRPRVLPDVGHVAHGGAPAGPGSRLARPGSRGRRRGLQGSRALGHRRRGRSPWARWFSPGPLGGYSDDFGRLLGRDGAAFSSSAPFFRSGYRRRRRCPWSAGKGSYDHVARHGRSFAVTPIEQVSQLPTASTGAGHGHGRHRAGGRVGRWRVAGVAGVVGGSRHTCRYWCGRSDRPSIAIQPR